MTALTVYNGELIAGGYFTTAGGVPCNYIARWDGATGSRWGRGWTATCDALTVYNGELIAGGSFTTAGGVAANDIARWDGSELAAAGDGMDGYRAYALTVYNGELIAGGHFTTAGGVGVQRHRPLGWHAVGRALGSGMNNDGFVNVGDLQLLVANWGKSVQ